MNNKVKVLTTIPSTDGNFISALKGATMEELDEALVFIEKNPIGQIARKCAILSEKKRRKKAEEKEQEEQEQMDFFHVFDKEDEGFIEIPAGQTPFDDNIPLLAKDVKTATSSEKEDEYIPMGTESLSDIVKGIPKPTEQEISEAKKINEEVKVENDVDTSFVDFALSIGVTNQSTYEKAAKILRTEIVKFRDDENLYVLYGLLEAAKEDEELAIGILRKGKSYKKAFSYFAKKSQEFGVKLESCYWLTKEQALPLAIEYYKIDEEEIARKKAEEEAERKKKAEEAATKKTRKKSTSRTTKSSKKEIQEETVVSAEVKTTTNVSEEEKTASGEIPDMSSQSSEQTDKKDDFVTKFSGFSFDGGGQLSFI